jgi:FxLD family lantipeptide
MSTTVQSARVPAELPEPSGAPQGSGDFDLDVSIVEAGDAVDALLCSTDNGCGTQSHNGC